MTADLFGLHERIAVVTGAGARIGRAIALGLARHGADVLACAIHPVGLATTIDEV